MSGDIMDSQFTKTKGAKFLISAAPTEEIPVDTTGMLPLEYTAKNLAMTAPAGDEIDVTVLGSPTKETIAGLPGEATVSNEGNIKIGDVGQDLLRASYETGDFYAFMLNYEDGSKVAFIARITNFDMSTPTHGVATGSFNYKVKGFFKFTAPTPVQGG